MYCQHCDREIEDKEKTTCPACGSSLTEKSIHDFSAEREVSGQDMKLRDLIADVKRNLEELAGDTSSSSETDEMAAVSGGVSPEIETGCLLDDSEESAFLLNAETKEALSQKNGGDNPFEAPPGDDDLDAFDLEKELNLPPEEAPQVEAESDAVAPAVLAELDALAPAGDSRPSRSLSVLAAAGALLICLAGGGLYVYTRPAPLPAAAPVTTRQQAAQKVSASVKRDTDAKSLPPRAKQNELPPQAQPDAEQKTPLKEQAQTEMLRAGAAEKLTGTPAALPAQPVFSDNASAGPPPQPSGAPESPPEKPAAYYTIHTDSYRVRRTADREVRRMTKAGFAASVQAVDLGAQGMWYRVVVGSFASPGEAGDVLGQLKQKQNKADTRIIQIEP